MIRVATVAVAMLGCGCASAEERPAPSPVRAAAADALTGTAKPSRGRMLGGERVRRVAQWPDDDAIDWSARDGLSVEASAAIDTLSLPALVSTDPAFAASTQVMAGKRWYATWAQKDGLTVTLNASGEARVYAHIPPFEGTHRVRDIEAFVTQNETIWSATWVEHGIAYDLGLECKSPTMPECQDEATIIELAESLAFVGPAEDVR
ncbi:MAG: hypothetical protein AAGA54_07690 [Myxococcota bacterium]